MASIRSASVDLSTRRRADKLSGVLRHGVRFMTTRGANATAVRIGRRDLSALIGPGFQIAKGIDHAAADLSVSWTRAVGAVLLEGAPGQTEVAAGFRGPQIAAGGSGCFHDGNSSTQECARRRTRSIIDSA
jgi:hypothetical protein